MITEAFSLSGRVAVVTGGAGLLGREHAHAISDAGGTAVLVDVDGAGLERVGAEVKRAGTVVVDITDPAQVRGLCDDVVASHGQIDILVNNAARNPAVGTAGLPDGTRLDREALAEWNADIAVGLTGAFLCSQAFGEAMAVSGRGGVILNIASDLSVISPDQRLYADDRLPTDQQPVKPVSYSVVKTGLIGLTRYMATYWAAQNVRVNALSPGGILVAQPQEFVDRLCDRIPLGRMAHQSEYRAAVVFLCSDASSYMTGQNLVMDGGRSVW